MEIVLPQFGLFFWTVLIFLAAFFILRRFAWKEILKQLDKRDQHIEESLKAAEVARAQSAQASAKAEELLQQARAERAALLAEADQARQRMMADAQERANAEYARRVQDAERQIKIAQQAAITELKNTVGLMALEIAEKLLRKELQKDEEQRRLVDDLTRDLTLN